VTDTTEPLSGHGKALESKPVVGDQTFDNWSQAIEHATNLEMSGKISRRELNDVKTAARQAGVAGAQQNATSTNIGSKGFTLDALNKFLRQFQGPGTAY